jgi:hypothetical protein
MEAYIEAKNNDYAEDLMAMAIIIYSTPPCSGSSSTSSSVVRRTSKATFRILIVIYGAFNDTIVCDDEQ